MNKLRKALLVILFISYIFKWTYLFLIGRNQNETQNAVINVNVPGEIGISSAVILPKFFYPNI